MSIFYNNLNLLCRRKGISLTNACKAVKTSTGNLTRWASGSIPRSSTAKLLADYFGVSVEDMLDKDLSESSPVQNKKPDEPSDYDKIIQSIGGYENLSGKIVPVLGTVAAGKPLYAEENIEGAAYCSHFEGEHFGLRVHGDSMDLDRIDDGDVVIVRKQESASARDIAVVLIDGEEATIKRIKIDGSMMMLIPHSSNPDNQPFVIDLVQHRVTILGKVEEVIHSVS